MTDTRGITVLIADDSDTDRLILEAIVRKEGHKVVSACNGVQAVEVFIKERPDIVLLDALMPELDGFGAALQIKTAAGQELVPIIFLTSLNDTDSLVKCLEAGGDDFLSKPYNHVILQAKIKSFQRMRNIHTTMLAQRDQIALNNEHFLQEQMVAKQVFDKITHGGCLNASNLRYSLSPLAIFNGDVVIAAMRPSGNMMVFLGDFTGHGLPAAIGAMPLASTFYEMVSKGFSINDVLSEVNGKLKDILPIGFFCCGIMVDVNFRDKNIKVWSGGLPSAFLTRSSGEVEKIKSSHLPLGVLSRKEFKTGLEIHPFNNGDKLFMWSDGIHEARNKAGEMYGEERLFSVFNNADDQNTIFDEVLTQVQEFVGEGEKTDDISIIELSMIDDVQGLPQASSASICGDSSLGEWDFQIEIKPSSFATFDPLPLLLNVLLEVPGLRNHSSTLYTIISELYNNALEHGILKLDSAIKDTEDGFFQYYEMRQERLSADCEGFIRIILKNHLEEDGGSLDITLQDSGDGFDETAQEIHTFSGRGLMLVKSLCESLTVNNGGRDINAIFSWKVDD